MAQDPVDGNVDTAVDALARNCGLFLGVRRMPKRAPDLLSRLSTEV